MKKRKGIFLLDALLGLLLLSLLAVGFFPLLSQASRALEMAGVRARVASDGVYAMDFMVEKIRNNLHATESATYVRRKNEYTYHAYNENGDDAGYRFFVDKEKLRLDIYGKTVQPITGETSSRVEPYAFEETEGERLFTQRGKGPLHIHFRMRHHLTGTTQEYETSVLTYADYYRKGEAGW